ncbi:MAG: NAD(+)/NADH kinase [Candidatus Geothermarchaeales archaeon]
MRAAGIIALRGNEEAAELARAIAEMLIDADFEVTVYPKISGIPSEALIKSRESEVSGDFVVTIGGDGTILRALQSVRPYDTPVLGIGIGLKNFLASVDKKNYIRAIQNAIDKKYLIKREMRLDVYAKGVRHPPVLNEVYFTSTLPGKTIEVHVEVDRSERRMDLWTSVADGVIVATPTGSTAYSLSAGGPMVDVSLHSITITPISPLIFRPSIVLPASDEVVLWAGERKGEALIILDGQIREGIGRGEEVRIRKSDEDACFITFKDEELRHIRTALRMRP